MTDLQPTTMTIKQVAESLNVSRDLIEKRVKELFPYKMKKGVTTLLTEYEVTALSVRIKENTSLITSDDRRRLPMTELEENMIIQQAYELIVSRNKNLQKENEQLKIELDESKKYHSVKKIKMMGYIPEISARKAWSPLKKWCIENDYKIISIFDANYGEVKTYHKDAWNAVYGVEI